MLDLRGYARVAKALGHEVAMYGPPNPAFALDYSKKLSDVDALVFVVEWTTALQFGDRLDWVRLMKSVPRHRRVVIDCDGAYNDPIEYGGDYNHLSRRSRAGTGSTSATACRTRSASRRTAAAAQRASLPVPHLRSRPGNRR